jgi:hypothetical protein
VRAEKRWEIEETGKPGYRNRRELEEDESTGSNLFRAEPGQTRPNQTKREKE